VPRRSHGFGCSTAIIALAAATALAQAADTTNFVPTAIKAPECIADASSAMFAQNVQPDLPPHPTLPIGRFYQIVRYIGDTSIDAPVELDFGHFPDSYAWPPYRGRPLTGLSVPDPKSQWQRASRADATMDTSSAFQMHCYDAGTFINTWTVPQTTIRGGGPHTVYGYSFDDARSPAVFDGDPGTDFVLQASVEIPWFAASPVATAPPGVEPIAQVSLFAYFRDRTSGKTFALLFAIFDNRFADLASYPAFIAHDGATPFASMPIQVASRYAMPSPYSGAFTGRTWSGLRFFRAQVGQANFRQMLVDVNGYCSQRPAQRYCAGNAITGTAYSSSVTDYEVTDFGVLSEVTEPASGHVSVGVHIYGLGAWNFR
jgi:hypothetical protein